MNRIAKKSLIASLILFTSLYSFAQGIITSNEKFVKWQRPSYFRGYNILYESPKTLQDFTDFKSYGGNLFQIGTDGFLAIDSPYDTIKYNVQMTDELAGYCREAGIHYVIAVRSGPGAYDVYDEANGKSGESRIWNGDNRAERQLYAEMLKMIAVRYSSDSLFVGLNLFVEPRPKYNLIPANSSGLYKRFLEDIYEIHMDSVYEFLINEIRKVDKFLPVIVQNFAFSTPELFPSYKINDPYVIYDAHMYVPYEYTHSDIVYSMSYPGDYKSITKLSNEFYDFVFMKNIVFSDLRSFQKETGAPILIGEFGMRYPQYGGSKYLGDVLDICLEYGWHFTLWDWRRGKGELWNIENFQDKEMWHTVINKFHSRGSSQDK
ncbi:MAG: glycoside hydrolase family 5 protein [Ignavibacteria bacterium]